MGAGVSKNLRRAEVDRPMHRARLRCLQQIIDDHSGAEFAAAMGTAWDNIEPMGMQVARDAGNSVTALSPEATAEFDAPFASVADRWIAEVDGIDIDGAALLDAAKAAIATHTD